jgi:hypothetical protein
MRTRDRRSTRMLATGLFAVAGLGLAGCGGEEPVAEEPVVEEGATEENPVSDEATGEVAAEPTTEGEMAAGEMAYEGPYDDAFLEEIDTYVDQDVMVSGEVSEVIAPDSFAISGATEPLLIVEGQEIPSVDEGNAVQITGTVEQAFDIVEVEEQLGTDLEDSLYTAYEGEPYVIATSAEVVEGE